MNDWPLFLLLISAVASLSFALVGFVWLRKLRKTLYSAVTETACHQLRNTQRFTETIDLLQKKQGLYEKRLQTLTEANIQMRQEINLIAGKIALAEEQLEDESNGSHMVH